MLKRFNSEFILRRGRESNGPISFTPEAAKGDAQERGEEARAAFASSIDTANRTPAAPRFDLQNSAPALLTLLKVLRSTWTKLGGSKVHLNKVSSTGVRWVALETSSGSLRLATLNGADTSPVIEFTGIKVDAIGKETLPAMSHRMARSGNIVSLLNSRAERRRGR